MEGNDTCPWRPLTNGLSGIPVTLALPRAEMSDEWAR